MASQTTSIAHDYHDMGIISKSSSSTTIVYNFAERKVKDFIWVTKKRYDIAKKFKAVRMLHPAHA